MYFFSDVLIKICSLFVFVLYIEFMISISLGFLGVDLVVCYDSNGVPIASDDGMNFDFWNMIILYALSLAIMPSIQKMQRSMRKTFED